MDISSRHQSMVRRHIPTHHCSMCRDVSTHHGRCHNRNVHILVYMRYMRSRLCSVMDIAPPRACHVNQKRLLAVSWSATSVKQKDYNSIPNCPLSMILKPEWSEIRSGSFPGVKKLKFIYKLFFDDWLAIVDLFLTTFSGDIFPK